MGSLGWPIIQHAPGYLYEKRGCWTHRPQTRQGDVCTQGNDRVKTQTEVGHLKGQERRLEETLHHGRQGARHCQ